MTKNSYLAAFNIQKAQNTLGTKLSEMGLHFEYGAGVIGQAMHTFVQECDVIIKEALGLHYEEVPVMCNIFGTNYETSVYVLYADDNDPEWSITEDDFCQFLYEAVTNEDLQELMWKAMVEKDINAKNEFNANKRFKIGPLSVNFNE